MTVKELNPDELQELRETYFYQVLDTNPEVLGDITDADEISDDSVINHYTDVYFVKEDFFCNL